MEDGLQQLLCVLCLFALTGPHTLFNLKGLHTSNPCTVSHPCLHSFEEITDES